MPKRTITLSQKKRIVARQHYKCANSPNKQLAGLEDHKCLLWQIEGVNQGIFDEAGYEIDHIIEHSLSSDDNDNNLQGLCVSCHRVKTTRFNSKNKINNKPSSIKNNELKNNKKIKLINKNNKNIKKIKNLNTENTNNKDTKKYNKKITDYSLGIPNPIHEYIIKTNNGKCYHDNKSKPDKCIICSQINKYY